MTFFEREIKTDEEAQEKIRELVIDIEKFIRTKKCSNCQIFNEGCKFLNFEAIEFIIDEIIKFRNDEISATIRKKFLYNPDLPKAIVSIARGISMVPAINDGDIIIERMGNEADTGDILSFISYDHNSKPSLINHRMIGRDYNFIYLKGDNNNGNIEKITHNAICGKISGIIKKEKEPELFD